MGWQERFSLQQLEGNVSVLLAQEVDNGMLGQPLDPLMALIGRMPATALVASAFVNSTSSKPLRWAIRRRRSELNSPTCLTSGISRQC